MSIGFTDVRMSSINFLSGILFLLVILLGAYSTDGIVDEVCAPKK